MSFKKPFRAAPVRLGPHALAKAQRRKRAAGRNAVVRAVGTALLAGVAIGVVWTVGSAERGQATVGAYAPYYPNCDAARAAGVAPLYPGESGYRPELARDSNGIACEPYRGF